MRVVFVMEYPGYLRYFDSTVALLAERGHEVQLAWDLPRKQAEGLQALEAMPERVSVGPQLPKRKDAWAPLSLALRATADTVRYLDPELAGATYLRRRMTAAAPAPVRALMRLPRLPRPVVRSLLRVLAACEAAIPVPERTHKWLRSARADVVVVTPLVTRASGQVDVVKAARALGLPVALAVASWDHLTTKGVMRVTPDAVLVWNEAQRAEAARLHGTPPDRVRATGAQNFDRWFERGPRHDPTAFRARSGLPADQPFVLFCGSTASISSPRMEIAWVRRWVAALREAPDARVRELAVLVRPHPYNREAWAAEDVSDLDGVAVFPRHAANPVDDDDRADYYDSLHHAAAVVGINTSAMIEAAIARTAVFTVQAPEFAETQGGTLHFHYMTPEHGGFVEVASGLDEHVAQLSRLLADPGTTAARIESFLGTFVRPHGLDRPATPIIVDAIEALRPAGAPARPRVVLRTALVPLALAVAMSDPRGRRTLGSPRALLGPFARSR